MADKVTSIWNESDKKALLIDDRALFLQMMVKVKIPQICIIQNKAKYPALRNLLFVQWQYFSQDETNGGAWSLTGWLAG